MQHVVCTALTSSSSTNNAWKHWIIPQAGHF